MHGPYKKLYFNRALFKSWKIFEARKMYTVVKSFNDFDNDLIEKDLIFTFLGCDYFPYDGGYTFMIQTDKDEYYNIRFQEDEQADILDNIGEYFKAC